MPADHPARSGSPRRADLDSQSEQSNERATRAGDRESRQQRRERARHRRRHRRLAVTSLLILGFLGATAYLLDWLASADSGAAARQPLATVEPPAEPTPVVPTSPTPPEPTEPAPVLSLPGDFPAAGPGRFQFSTEQGDPMGESGQLRRFRIAVEDGVEEDVDEFAEFVDETLGAEQGWTAGGEFQFQRVPDGAPYDFTIYLATSGTTAQICAQGGLDVLGSGLPEGGVSCRIAGQVVLNLHRWRLSVTEFVDEQVPLAAYRQMLVNHEVGHELGFGHNGCSEPGGPAPVMQQQSLFLDGCEPYPWPYLDGERHTGPPVA